jgi:hypothetical protein
MAETKTISFNKTVYDKVAADTVLNKSFKEFGQSGQEASKTVEQFFLDYEDLFYQIPAKGETNSHQYLVERSSEMYKDTSDLDSVQPLLDEINSLKNQLVVYEQTIIDLKTQLNSK